MATVFFTAGVKDQQQDKHEQELRTLVVPHISNIFPPNPPTPSELICTALHKTCRQHISMPGAAAFDV